MPIGLQALLHETRVPGQLLRLGQRDLLLRLGLLEITVRSLSGSDSLEHPRITLDRALTERLCRRQSSIRRANRFNRRGSQKSHRLLLHVEALGGGGLLKKSFDLRKLVRGRCLAQGHSAKSTAPTSYHCQIGALFLQQQLSDLYGVERSALEKLVARDK